jgi:hypothetical protein
LTLICGLPITFDQIAGVAMRRRLWRGSHRSPIAAAMLMVGGKPARH